MDMNPFLDLHVTDWSFLDECNSRQPCPRCLKSRKYFCYTCHIALPHIKDKLPHVKLPVKVDIIKHPNEIDGKSTSTHAAILAPDDVTIYTYPHIPDYKSEKVVLAFPGTDAVSLDELLIGSPSSQHSKTHLDLITMFNKEEGSNGNFSILSNISHNSTETLKAGNVLKLDEHLTEGDPENGTKSLDSSTKRNTSRKRAYNCTGDAQSQTQLAQSPEKVMKMEKLQQLPFERVIFIDSTWNQTRNIINDERLKDFQRVELKSRPTKFWRKQPGIPCTYLSTIEAIFYFMKDLHVSLINTSYNCEYDDLLFLFCFMYNKITNSSGAQLSKSS